MEIHSQLQASPRQRFDPHSHKINGFRKRKNRVNLCFKIIINLGMIFTFYKVIKFSGGSINFLTLKQPHTRGLGIINWIQRPNPNLNYGTMSLCSQQEKCGKITVP